jgi:hypothetical protein
MLLFMAACVVMIACECACMAQDQTPAASAAAPNAVDNKDSKSNVLNDSKNSDAKSATPGSVTPSAKETGGFLGLGKKEIYTGPTEIVVLTPTPMLDNEGKQRLDPDGKPMFNSAVKQQRDKFGHPLFNEHGKPVFQTATDLGYDEHGHKLHAEKVKPPKMTPVSIAQGTYTVDGVIGKAELNYDIADLKYIYLYAPGIGVTVISNVPFPGAKEQLNAFNDKTLTVTVSEHTLQLYSENRLLAKPQPGYVMVDRDFILPSKFPVMGYGDLRAAPYAWPGAKQGKILAGPVTPPPVPVNLRPVMLLAPCPAGQMRTPAPKVLPGEVAPPQPCVAIAKALPSQASAKPVSSTTTTPLQGQNLVAPK